MRSRKRRKSHKSAFGLSKFFALGFLLLLIVLGLRVSLRSDFGSQLSSPTPIPFPTKAPVTPTVTLTPTPTLVPLVGYCLRVPVLLYHHIQPEKDAYEKNQFNFSVDNGVFDQQIGYLVAQGYQFLTAKELVDALRGKSPLPAKSILITLDDGYLDQYRYAYPVFKKYNVKANLMIATGLLNGADYLSWANLEEMARSGLMYVTDHTWSHYAVGYGAEDKIRYEITTARDQLREHTGQMIEIFTYPFGSFSDLSIDILRQEGFTGAFSTIFGDWQCDSFIMALHRRRIGSAPLSIYGL